MKENMRIARREWWKWVLTGFVLLSGIWITREVEPAALCVIVPLCGCPGVLFLLFGLWIATCGYSDAVMERRERRQREMEDRELFKGCVRPVGEEIYVIYAEGEGSWLDE